MPGDTQGEAGLPLPRGPHDPPHEAGFVGAPAIEDFGGWVLTPTVQTREVAAFPPVVADGQRLAGFGRNSIGPAGPGLPAAPHVA